MIQVLELFAGIGACSKALTNLGIEHEIVDAVEIDKYAIRSFNAVHGTNFEPQDITQWDKDLECDIILHGSPCQDFSIAGKQAGGDEGTGTRSSLMYESLRIIEKIRPRYVIWENVKNVLSAKHRPNFEAYQKAMVDLGYTNYYQVLNAKDYGVPQNRERVFTVSILGDEKYIFPEPVPLEKRLKDVLETEVDEKYYLGADKFEDITRGNNYDIINGGTIGRMHDSSRRAYHIDGVAPAMHTCGGGNTEPKIIDDIYKSRPAREYEKYSPTLRAAQAGNLKVDNPPFRIRKLTPSECWKLMGFSEEDCKKAMDAGMSNCQLYKQAGNSIVVDVLMAIFRELL